MGSVPTTGSRKGQSTALVIDPVQLLDTLLAIKRGDFTARMPAHHEGIAGKIYSALNDIAEQNERLSRELSRIAHTVGREGRSAEPASLSGAQGSYADCISAINVLVGDVMPHISRMTRVLEAAARGNLDQELPLEIDGRDLKGQFLTSATVVNKMLAQLSAFAGEVTRVAREVGTDGKLGGQAVVQGVGGIWKDLTDNVNFMAANLTNQVRNIAQVTTAIAKGDLSSKITVDARGEILELKNTINIMIDQLGSFASEVTRVAREVGTEGKLGGQADLKGQAGIWKDLTLNVNSMAGNITDQVRNIAQVTTAVAKGDLSTKISVDARGEILALKNTVNTMVDQLGAFASEVTRVAREVGNEGKFGGQAVVPGVAGMWKDLTENVNSMATNLSARVRNITEQDWLKTNLAKFSQMLQGQRDLTTVAEVTLSELARLIHAQQGVLYIAEMEEGETVLRHLASYAYRERKHFKNTVKLGEGLLGQSALEKNMIVLTDVPGDHIAIHSGLGASKPLCIVVLPVVFERQVKAVIELASFARFSDVHLQFLDQFAGGFGIVLNTIAANMRTEEFLKQSQALTEELQRRQDELTATNTRLAEQAGLLSDQKAEVEQKNREVEQAKRSLEEKAEQLALTSRYKSEFLANMSHELRTPINSLLILSELLADNTDGNLSAKQIEFARTIHASGTDLIALINDILDLSKIESGTITLELGMHALTDLGDYVERTFGPMAESKGLRLQIEMDPDVPKQIRTDFKRLKQVLKNLLANAFKFTDNGEVRMRVRRAGEALAFDVSDTGIGIPTDQQAVIFEAFRQADGTTSRKYGGTGLGLSISRELAKLLGGEIKVQSTPNVGSTFTLITPLDHSAPQTPIASPAERFGKPAETKTAEPTALFIGDEAAFSASALGEGTGFKARAAFRADSALARAMETPPDVVVLDADLSDTNAWTVLDRFKHDPTTRHVPTIMVAGVDERLFALSQGALACVARPATAESLKEPLERARRLVQDRRRSLLLMCTDEVESKRALEVLKGEQIEIAVTHHGAEALALLRSRRFDCAALNPFVDDTTPESFLARLHQIDGLPPIALFFGASWENRAALDPALHRELRRKVALQAASSVEELLNVTSLFMHRAESSLPSAQRRVIEKMRGDDPLLRNKTALVVDDDARNVFALSNILERHKVRVIVADGGVRALELLKSAPQVDIVLTDIMMAGVDGYQTARAIREMDGLQNVPIIAVTALAMKGDRERCIEAGASDYLTKPIERDQLLATLRVALLRKEMRG